MRVYELAKELGIESKEFLEILKKLNFPVKSHLSVIDKETAEIIKHEIEDLKEKEIKKNVVKVDFPLTVKELAIKINCKPSEIITSLLKEGKMVTINQTLDEDLAKSIARRFGVTLEEKPPLEEVLLKKEVEASQLKVRAPIVTFMGHIDHGKTSLLDYIRKSNLTSRESGGITQHIGAYQVVTSRGKITFIDTPGHETFTSMRARGANVTDIVILVVAAEEGVKAQTEEAIDHARAANVPIIVAINKIDKPNADVERVKEQLSKLGLVPEDWGGKTIMVGVSAKTGEGVEELLEMILLESELLELKADFQRPAIGVVLEGRVSGGLGSLVTVIIQEGTLRVGEFGVAGTYWGKIRLIRNDRGQSLNFAEPSSPVEIAGLSGVPLPGEKFFVVPGEKEAQQICEREREAQEKHKESRPQHIRLEDLYKKIREGEVKQLRLIIKADTYGTLEAVVEVLNKIDIKEIELQILHKGVGVINLSDVILADASDGLIIGFKVGIDSVAAKRAQELNLQIKTYQIIYELISDIKTALEGMLQPIVEKVFLGRARVRRVFKLSRWGVIAGCFVEKGKILRGSLCSLKRREEVIFEGKIVSLKRFKDDVREVNEGFECGIGIGYDKIQEDDLIEVFEEKLTSRQIEI